MSKVFSAIALFVFVLLAARPSFAAGGTCPSGNITIDTNGNPITLASIGVTSCFYVSKSTGSDNNAGTTEAAPWAHLPGMPSCTGTCAATTPGAGEGFILRGGETWVNGDLGVTWNWGGASSSSQLYIGVDPTWFNSGACGGSWCRPIWNFSGTTNANAFLASSSKSYWFLDNIEIKAMCNGENGVYVQGATNIRASRLYFHGWTHCVSSDNVGFFSQGGAGATADHNIIDGSDSSKNTFNAFFSYWSTLQYNYIQYVVSGLIGRSDVVHDNVLLNTVTSADGDHCNGFFTFSPDSGSSQLIYNNVVSMGTGCPGGVNMWFNGNGSTDSSWVGYGFGNIMFNTSGGNLVNFGNHSAGNYGTYYFFNNTVDCSNGGCGGTPSSGPYWSIYDQNNHVIGGTYLALTPPSGGTVLGPCSEGAGTGCTDLSQSESIANGQGYRSTESHPYSPSSSCTPSTCGTVQSGKNLQSVCTAISSVNASAGAACQSGTSEGCSYNTSNHTLSCPSTPLNSRPGTAAWDIGAYQFSSSQAPPPPTNLTGTAH